MLHPANPDTIGNKLAAKLIERSDVDAGIYNLSRALEHLCCALANELRSSEAKHLAHTARDYASNVRKFAEEARDTQSLVDKAN
jgi:hypothetical protein